MIRYYQVTAISEAESEIPDESPLENSPSVQDIQLNQWKLPPKLDVEWPKGHGSLWELISNEVGDYVEEVGISVLTALGADVVTSRRLAGISERHFELDVKWPNGGNHVLEEVKNHHSEKATQIEDKVDQLNHQIEAKMSKMEAKIEVKIEPKIEVKMAQMENMIEKLLEKMT